MTTILQYLVFWLMLAAMLSTFADIEKQRGVAAPAPDGLQPVNRRLMKGR